MKQVFESYSDDVSTLLRMLQLQYGVELPRRKSLVIFDEVQRFPKAREMVKHLVADGRFDYIETGSLISIKKNVANIVIPSEEDRVYLRPMDFEEYLWALGRKMLADDESDAGAMVGLARNMMDRGQYDEAEKQLFAAAKMSENYPSIYRIL